MVECWLPYGKTEIHISVPIRDLLGVAEPPRGQSAQHPVEAVKESLRNPVDGPQIAEIARLGSSVAIAVSGTMLPQLARDAVSSIVDELVSVGVSAEAIDVIIGYGYRERGNPDLSSSLREALDKRGVRVTEHTGHTQGLVDAGTTSRKTLVEVNGVFASADAHVAVGEVLLDALTGYRGPHSAILPGVTGIKTTEMNRSHAFEDGVAPAVTEGNPVLADALEASRLAGVDLAVNLVASPQGSLLMALSGSPEGSWNRALHELGDSFRVKAEANADILVASAGGIGFDFDLYNAAWALRNVSTILKKGAPVVLVAECSEGLGAGGLSHLSHIDTLSELRRRYILGAEAVHLIKSTAKSNRLHLVSALPSRFVEALGFTPARTANEALASASRDRRGRNVLALTHGCSTLPLSA